MTKFFRLFAAVLALIAAPLASAHAAGEASGFINKLGTEALQVLSTKGVQSADGQAQFKQLLDDNFDVQGIGKFVLGRAWNTATPEQQADYQSLFKVLVEQIYTERFSGYAGETFKVLGEKPGNNDTDTIVNTQVVHTNGAPPVGVDWTVRREDGGLKIFDVVVEGVSMSVTQRSEFASVIQRNGGKIDALLQLLRQRTGSGPAVAK